MPWSYALDDDDSEAWAGTCETKEEAIAEGIRELVDDVAERLYDPDWKDVPGYEPHFYIGFGEKLDPAEAFDAGEIIERANEYFFDNYGGDDTEVLEVARDAEQKLQQLLTSWARENLKVLVWTIGKVERVEFPLDQLPKDEDG